MLLTRFLFLIASFITSGGLTEDIALKYYGHLKWLMDLIRAALLTNDLPVVIGKI